MKEEWKDIKGFYGYKASNKGRIKSFLTDKENGKVLSQRDDKDGYKMVWTKYKSTARVHQLVLLAFDYKNYKEGLVVNHKNGIKDDNRLENLEWCTISYNTKHGYKIGVSFSSLSNPVAVKHNNEILSIFNSMSTLAEYCKLSRATIENIVKNNEFLFDELKIEKLSEKRYDYHERFQFPFINKHMINYNSSPCKYGNKYYESIKHISEETGYTRSKISWRLRNNKTLDDKELRYITRYEYIRQ